MPYQFIIYKGLDLRVNYDYQPEEKMVMYYGDGSGYPGCAESLEINTISLGDYDLTELLENDRGKITDAIYAEWRKNDVRD